MANIKQKTIKVRKHNLIDTRQEVAFKKWKLWLCKFIKIPILHRYQFIYNIEYYAGNIYKGDVVVNSQGVAFLIMSEGNKMATMISHDPKSEQPRVSGLFNVISKAVHEPKTEKQ